jgi:hypothetical protein
LEYTELLRCDFTPDEWAESARQLATATRLRSELEQEKKEIDSQYKAKIEEQIGRASKLAALLGAGYEMRNVPCEIIVDKPEPGQATIVRQDTGEIVRTRPMTDMERQAVLDFMVNHPAEEPKPPEPPPSEAITDKSRLIEARAYPSPVHDDLYSDAEPAIRRLMFAVEGQKQRGGAEIRFLEIGPDQWVSAVTWDLGYGKRRQEPLRANVTFQTGRDAILDAANLIFHDMEDHIGAGNRTLAKSAHAVMDWADSVIAENGGPRTAGPEAA